jgi:phenylalanyl-tRNA synthetase alpha chain
MQKNTPPIRIIVPGRTFRNEAIDATHEAQFHQVEGLMVGEKVSMANLKTILSQFFREFFDSSDLKVRLRPAYFPFVEPGIEADMTCHKCGNTPVNSCNVCKGSG